MKVSSETMIVLGALLLAALMAGQESRNEWKVTYSRTSRHGAFWYPAIQPRQP